MCWRDPDYTLPDTRVASTPRFLADAELFEGRDRRDRRQRGWRAQCLVADFPGAQRRRLDDPRGRRLLLGRRGGGIDRLQGFEGNAEESDRDRSDEQTYELTSLMRKSYAGYCLKKEISKQSKQ